MAKKRPAKVATTEDDTPEIIRERLKRQRDAFAQDFETLENYWPTLQYAPMSSDQLRKKLVAVKTRIMLSLQTTAGRQPKILEYCRILGVDGTSIDRLFNWFISGNVCDERVTIPVATKALKQLDSAISAIEFRMEEVDNNAVDEVIPSQINPFDEDPTRWIDWTPAKTVRTWFHVQTSQGWTELGKRIRAAGLIVNHPASGPRRLRIHRSAFAMFHGRDPTI